MRRLLLPLAAIVVVLSGSGGAHQWDESWAKDDTCRGNHARLLGGAVLLTTVGKEGDSIADFPAADATSRARIAGTNADLDLAAEFTVAMWVYPRAVPGATDPSAPLFARGVLSSGEANRGAFSFAIGGAGLSKFIASYHGTSDSTSSTAQTSSSLSTNAWQHVIASRSGGALYVYLNNANEGTASANVAASAGDQDAFLGYPSQSQRVKYNGLLDDFRLYNRALTTQERADLYDGVANAGLSSGLVTHLRFEPTLEDEDPCAPTVRERTQSYLSDRVNATATAARAEHDYGNALANSTTDPLLTAAEWRDWKVGEWRPARVMLNDTAREATLLYFGQGIFAGTNETLKEAEWRDWKTGEWRPAIVTLNGTAREVTLTYLGEGIWGTGNATNANVLGHDGLSRDSHGATQRQLQAQETNRTIAHVEGLRRAQALEAQAARVEAHLPIGFGAVGLVTLLGVLVARAGRSAAPPAPFRGSRP